MDVDFAVTCPLVRPGLPRIRFLCVRSRFGSTLISDAASRRRPCASLALHLHQVVKGTCTPKLSNMLGTQVSRSRGRTVVACVRSLRLLIDPFPPRFALPCPPPRLPLAASHRRSVGRIARGLGLLPAESGSRVLHQPWDRSRTRGDGLSCPLVQEMSRSS